MISTNFPIRNENKLKDWEVNIIRKTDFLTLVGTFNVLFGLVFLNLINFPGLNIHFYAVFLLAVLTFTANRLGQFLVSTYLFFAIGNYLLSMIVLLMGSDTYSLMFFFPITMSIVQIFGRKETFHHLIVWLIIYFLNVTLLLFFSHHFTPIEMTPQTKEFIINFNVLLSFFCGLALIAIITWNSISLETSIRRTANEKELLLAELFHRVKNNLNLVTSLLNIRKNRSNSKEVAEALEDCRNRVFSMALVHNKLYSESKIGSLNLNDFVRELIYSIELNLGDEAEVTIETPEIIYLSVSKAVPSGLILNELLTNVYKHGRVTGRKLNVNLTILQKEKELTISVTDNGPGVIKQALSQEHLGLELIQSLTEQLDGEFSLNNNTNGIGATAILRFKF